MWGTIGEWRGISKCPLIVELLCGGMLGGADSSPVITYVVDGLWMALCMWLV